MGNNLTSPNSITAPCNLSDLKGWYTEEISNIENEAVRSIMMLVGRSLDELVRWPTRSVLFWQGCDRVVEKGSKTKYHQYPEQLKAVAKAAKVYLDGRVNGPAIAAFMISGGERPERFGSSNAWSVHHLYSGKFPYLGRKSTTHAAKSCEHFTQSAGLVAVHPITDALCDESPALTWLLRAKAFDRFGYDPDGVFSSNRDRLGFAGSTCEIMFRSEPEIVSNR
jgi:hypothetical protein